MFDISLPLIGSVPAWRRHARALAERGVPPSEVLWRIGEDQADLFAGEPLPSGETGRLRLARAALDEIETALCHSDPERFARAYGVVLRLGTGELTWPDRRDAAVQKLLQQASAVRRDVHKMHAFVRFRELPRDGPRRRFAAWFEPDHPIVERAAPFFAARFGDMDWAIATPSITARFADGALDFIATDRAAPPPRDDTEELWKTYYASIFNPARLMPRAMRGQMPAKYWRNLPEASLIPDLVRHAETEAGRMARRSPEVAPDRRRAALRTMAAGKAESMVPGSIDAIRTEAASCTRCPLFANATQTVFGEGPPDAAVMFVGEQPGDMEDLAGRPFVGPAGQLFDEEAKAAGLDRAKLYVTNAVKHFKFVPRGKRRIHQRPDRGEIQACRWWLDLERAAVRPKLIVAMGAIAAGAVTGSAEGILRRRSQVERTADGTPVFLTVHPSYILRLPDRDLQREERGRFRADLVRVAQLAGEIGSR